MIRMTCQNFDFIGIKLDKEINHAAIKREGVTRATESRAKVTAVPNDEGSDSFRHCGSSAETR